MHALFGLIINVNKDSSLKVKARTKDWRFKDKVRTKDLTFKVKARTKDSRFVLQGNQGPRPRTTSLLTTDSGSILR